MKKLAICALVSTLLGCSGETSKNEPAIQAKTAAPNVFSQQQAIDNLRFAKSQYLKMIEHIEQNQHLHLSPECKSNPSLICFPRAEEFGEIYIEKPTKWTNGFYPGLLWKLLVADETTDILSKKEKQKLKQVALFYQNALESESRRGTTHDLGFILYDSYGEALAYSGLDEHEKQKYKQILETGRQTLSTRYHENHKLIKSWDFVATFRILHKENEQIQDIKLPIASPWSYPVIVDNMMNLEFLFASKDPKFEEIAFNHAANTLKNHYFYEASDTNKERPIAYHLIDYDTMRPGNWQGMGAISAWARGQAWSFYGFVTVLDALQSTSYPQKDFPDFERHLDRLFNTVDYLLKDDVVPMWDFFATKADSKAIAANQDPATTAYSRILDLCPSRIANSILPYEGYSPILVNKSILTDESLTQIKSLHPVNGGSFIENGKVSPCGSEDYDLTGRVIPKDTSAAAIFAAGMYRYAKLIDDVDKKQKLINLADRIMAKLTNEYRTDKDKNTTKSHALGFVLSQATGNMPEASEINTPIVYADFYFVEANMRKLELLK